MKSVGAAWKSSKLEVHSQVDSSAPSRLLVTGRTEPTDGTNSKSGAANLDQRELFPYDAGSRSIAHMGGEVPAWITSTTSNPWRS